MSEKFWDDKRVMITGGSGFLGKNLVPQLEVLGAQIFVPRSKDFDLRREGDVKELFMFFSPEIVIHAAAHGGGIGHMREHPGCIFYDNIMMNTLVLDEARKNEVEKFVGIGTVCSYPKYATLPFKEENLWEGYPEETNASYGLTKKMMLVQTQAYHQEYGFNSIHLLFVNMYGPHDDFDLRTSHAIPALIRKFIDAKENGKKEVVVWGTGTASREFLYVQDATEAIVLATERYNKSDPLNIGSGEEITIRNLANLIKKLTEYEGKIIWDTTKPDGQPKRKLDVSKARQEFGFRAKTDLKDGLKKTIDWYKDM